MLKKAILHEQWIYIRGEKDWKVRNFSLSAFTFRATIITHCLLKHSSKAWGCLKTNLPFPRICCFYSAGRCNVSMYIYDNAHHNFYSFTVKQRKLKHILFYLHLIKLIFFIWANYHIYEHSQFWLVYLIFLIYSKHGYTKLFF